MERRNGVRCLPGPAACVDGRPRKAGESASYTFFGSLPGTWVMVKQREDGVNLAVLFNQREDPSGLSYYDIEGMLDQAADRRK